VGTAVKVAARPIKVGAADAARPRAKGDAEGEPGVTDMAARAARVPRVVTRGTEVRDAALDTEARAARVVTMGVEARAVTMDVETNSDAIAPLATGIGTGREGSQGGTMAGDGGTEIVGGMVGISVLAVPGGEGGMEIVGGMVGIPVLAVPGAVAGAVAVGLMAVGAGALAGRSGRTILVPRPPWMAARIGLSMPRVWLTNGLNRAAPTVVA
jgi:hypothetical protein